MSTQDTLVMLGEAAIKQRGYEGFSYADIAKLAGIRKASIHHHFPAKTDLALAVLQNYAERTHKRFDQIAADSRSGGQALKEAIAVYREALTEDGAMCLCNALATDTHALNDELRGALAEFNAKITHWLEEALRRGRADRSISVAGEPELEAVGVLAQIQGAQLLARLARDPALYDLALTSLHARINRY